MTATLRKIIETPIEIRFPDASIQDHGLELIHDLTGTPRNYLHTVSVVGGSADEQMVQENGYRPLYGWRHMGGDTQFWTYSKQFSLGVANW